MVGRAKPTPLAAFGANMEDADRLVMLAEAFTNARTRRMRQEMREKIGSALGYARRDRDSLDCALQGRCRGFESLCAHCPLSGLQRLPRSEGISRVRSLEEPLLSLSNPGDLAAMGASSWSVASPAGT